MVARDCRPRYPLDRTVRADRRPRHLADSAAAGTAEAAVRCRAGLSGGGPGPARRPLGAPLAATVLWTAGAPVSVPAPPARLSQAGQGRGAADQPGRAGAGRAVPVLGRRPAP